MRYLAALSLAALVLASNAGAGIYVKAVRPTQMHVGAVLQVRISAGLRLWEKIPVYIVASSSALRPHACGRNAICEPKVARAPTGGAYRRIATVSFRHVLNQEVAIRVPSLKPGRYEIAFYCGVCYRGPGGSLIATPTQAFDIVR
jgi:hypothetical protein